MAVLLGDELIERRARPQIGSLRLMRVCLRQEHSRGPEMIAAPEGRNLIMPLYTPPRVPAPR